MLDFALARRTMVDSQVRTFDVTDIPLLAVLEAVPRERFVPPGLRGLAYIDKGLPVAEGVPGADARMMLPAMVLARMIQNLELRAGARVLDVAGGLGYGAAVMAGLGAEVVALESTEAMAAAARECLTAEASGVEVVAGPLAEGFPAGAPYTAILVHGAVERRPEGLLAQLAEGGRLVCIEGGHRTGRATLHLRNGGTTGSRVLFDAVAPLLPEFRAEPAFVF